MPVLPPPPFRSRIAGSLALASLLALAACSSDGAFVDRRRDAGHPSLTYVGKSKPDAPSICYNRWQTTPEQVVALANEVCAERGQVAVLKNQAVFDCRVLFPARANFRCVDKSEAALWEYSHER